LEESAEHMLDYEEIMSWEGRYRANLINKIIGYKPANLIGTRSSDGRENLALFNSLVHIGANPPYLGFILRPATVPRHTYENIRATGFYTVNAVTTKIHGQAHMTSAKYEADTSEFEACGLTPVYLGGFQAPFVAESPVRIGMSFVEEHLITCNDTRLIIGRVECLQVPEGSIGPDGHLSLDQLGLTAIGGLDTYYQANMIDRYAYARPGSALSKVDTSREAGS
jgi:flavin reductase (DIM6/NTAB) family NADH-FMN oxidoreductase RutF